MFGKHTATACLSLCLALVGAGWSISAGAVSLTIPAITMTPQDGLAALSENSGLLDGNGATGVYVAPVNIPVGQKVCRLEFWSRDYQAANNMTARMKRKQLLAAVDNVFGPAVQTMATVASAGATNGIQKRTTVAITNPTISSSYVYWVEVEFAGGFYQALAVTVVYMSSC